jgi:hypothetical protein
LNVVLLLLLLLLLLLDRKVLHAPIGNEPGRLLERQRIYREREMKMHQLVGNDSLPGFGILPAAGMQVTWSVIVHDNHLPEA